MSKSEQESHASHIDVQQPRPTEDRLQFSDGRLAFGYRTPGDKINWDEHKYTRYLNNLGGPDVAIVGMASGRRFAIGNGVAVMLPDFSKENGRFNVQGELSAKSAIDDLPNITIGEPWQLLGDDDAVSDVVVDYTNT